MRATALMHIRMLLFVAGASFVCNEQPPLHVHSGTRGVAHSQDLSWSGAGSRSTGSARAIEPFACLLALHGLRGGEASDEEVADGSFTRGQHSHAAKLAELEEMGLGKESAGAKMMKKMGYDGGGLGRHEQVASPSH